MAKSNQDLHIQLLEAPDGIFDPFAFRIIPIKRSVMERIIQEEVWSQTFWPSGEMPMAELVSIYYKIRFGVK